MKELDYTSLAERVMIGFQTGDINPTKINLNPAEFQKLYRRSKKDKFSGSVPLYICKKIYDNKFLEFTKAYSKKTTVIAIQDKSFTVNFSVSHIALAEAFCIYVWASVLATKYCNNSSLLKLEVAFKILSDVIKFESMKEAS